MSELTLKPLTGEREEMEDLQRVLEESSDYMQRITGYPKGQADAQSQFSILPPGKTYDDKFVYGIYLDGDMIGCIDIIRGYPTDNIANLGLLLLSEKYRSGGFGRQAYSQLEEIIKSWKCCDKIRCAVVMTNDIVIPFWKKMGFRHTGEVKPYEYDHLVSEIVFFEKNL